MIASGFKNLGNLALLQEQRGQAVVFSYEEALGYAVSAHIKDKDGVSAAVRARLFLCVSMADGLFKSL